MTIITAIRLLKNASIQLTVTTASATKAISKIIPRATRKRATRKSENVNPFVRKAVKMVIVWRLKNVNAILVSSGRAAMWSVCVMDTQSVKAPLSGTNVLIVKITPWENNVNFASKFLLKSEFFWLWLEAPIEKETNS